MSEERRKHNRVPTLIDLAWEGAAGKYEARTSDLSMGGCFIDTIAQVAVGEMIKFKLRLPAGDWIEMQGEVVYTQPSLGFGVRFTTISDYDRKRLKWLVKAEAYRADKQK
jgi:Tfp pilus assembly protein PilZ